MGGLCREGKKKKLVRGQNAIKRKFSIGSGKEEQRSPALRGDSKGLIDYGQDGGKKFSVDLSPKGRGE